MNDWFSRALGLGSSVVLVLAAMLLLGNDTLAQDQAGSIRGVVYDRDFDAPLPLATVTIVETGATAESTEQGNYVFREVTPGTYTLTFSKPGYNARVQTNVVVTAGQLTDVDAWLEGEFTEMEEFVVQDLFIGGGTEAGLLALRFDSPALMDSIGADLMNRAGASDAASALRLIAGATVEDGKFPVVRGLPDRYVNSQLNGVRLPTADENKRAVELDLFPAAVIESIQVSKTFTPDQQGDATGGAVNVLTKSIPAESGVLSFQAQVGQNTNVAKAGDNFLTYNGGGVDTWGLDDGQRDIQSGNIGSNWAGAAGVSRGAAPPQYKFAGALGGRSNYSDMTVGGYLNMFYERDAAYFDDGQFNDLWVENPGDAMTPQRKQQSADNDFKTALFDVTQSSESVQWGGLGTIGLESENHKLGLTTLYTHTAEDKVTLAEDTRGKEFFFPGYDPDDINDPGNSEANRTAAPYLRLETLEYTERTTGTVQLAGEHQLGDFAGFHEASIDWVAALSVAKQNQPDKRQFGSLFLPRSAVAGGILEPTQLGLFPDANINLGNFQRIWKTIDENSQQFAVNLNLPFDQWDGYEGYLKTGIFYDKVTREFDQETFANFEDSGSSFAGDFDDFWSESFPFENHPIEAFLGDIDYNGDQDISAAYGMADLPLAEKWKLIGGARLESTKISIVNIPEEDALWFPPGSSAPVDLEPGSGDADASIDQTDLLPSLGVVYNPSQTVTLRASYGETIARPIFKELTPIIQQEFLGGPIFIGNPELMISSIQNFDFRADYTPYAGGLFSTSLFHKELDDPIENVQVIAPFTHIKPFNFPKGRITGIEVEARQQLGFVRDSLEGLQVGANATYMDSEVELPPEQVMQFAALGVPQTTRESTRAPEYLLNLFASYDLPTFTRVSLFYTLTGDQLIAGGGQEGPNFVPDLYLKPVARLNFQLAQRLGKYFQIQFRAKNLLNPKIETVYRSDYIPGDTVARTFTEGIDLSLAISAEFTLN